jgi:hypothetical protein
MISPAITRASALTAVHDAEEEIDDARSEVAAAERELAFACARLASARITHRAALSRLSTS